MVLELKYCALEIGYTQDTEREPGGERDGS